MKNTYNIKNKKRDKNILKDILFARRHGLNATQINQQSHNFFLIYFTILFLLKFSRTKQKICSGKMLLSRHPQIHGID